MSQINCCLPGLNVYGEITVLGGGEGEGGGGVAHQPTIPSGQDTVGGLLTGIWGNKQEKEGVCCEHGG